MSFCGISHTEPATLPFFELSEQIYTSMYICLSAQVELATAGCKPTAGLTGLFSIRDHKSQVVLQCCPEVILSKPKSDPCSAQTGPVNSAQKQSSPKACEATPVPGSPPFQTRGRGTKSALGVLPGLSGDTTILLVEESSTPQPWRRAWQPTPVSSPGEAHGQRSLVGYGPW